jgi:hypothetical protein
LHVNSRRSENALIFLRVRDGQRQAAEKRNSVQRILIVLSLLCFLLWGGAFTLSFMDPLVIERAAREVVRIEVERRVGGKIDSLSNSRVADLAQRSLQNTEAEIARTQALIRDEVPRKVAKVVADMLNADCECRKRLVEYQTRSPSPCLASLR